MKQSRHRFSAEPILKIMAAGALVLATGLCLAGDIYRWVDEQGHTHLGDAVPERYKAVATRINSRRFELSQSDRLAAEARVVKERQAAVEAERARAEAAGRQAPASIAAASRPAAKPGNDPASQCDHLWREYFKSQECFAPYNNRYGGLRGEAFERCTQVVSPAQQCGPAKNIGTN
jgi:hypothetical protein